MILIVEPWVDQKSDKIRILHPGERCFDLEFKHTEWVKLVVVLQALADTGVCREEIIGRYVFNM